jgi:hypothetical protein
VFAVSSDGKPTAAVEIERGHRKEAEQVTRGANYFRSVYRAGSASAAAAAASSVVADADSGFTRVKSGSDQYSKGQLYLKAALEARDGKPEEVMERGQTINPDLSAAGKDVRKLIVVAICYDTLQCKKMTFPTAVPFSFFFVGLDHQFRRAGVSSSSLSFPTSKISSLLVSR